MRDVIVLFFAADFAPRWDPSLSEPKTLHSGPRELLRLQRQEEKKPVPALHLRPCQR